MPVERRGVKALQIWCSRVTATYPGVAVVDMSSSWRDGLAFCALIHHFRPKLVDFYKLRCEDILHNNTLAFSVAEEHLGIPSLLDPQDMVDSQVPDKFSIITYVSQFYHLLKEEDISCVSPSLARALPRQVPQSSDTDPTDSSSGEISPPPSLASHSPVLANNRFSPMVPTDKVIQISLGGKTHLKSQEGVTVSGVCEDFSRKIQIFQER